MAKEYEIKNMQWMLEDTELFIKQRSDKEERDIKKYELSEILLDGIYWGWHRFEKFAEAVAKEDDQFDAEKYLFPLRNLTNENNWYYKDPILVMDRLQGYAQWSNNLKGNTLPCTGSRMKRRVELYNEIVGKDTKDLTTDILENSAYPHCMGLLGIWCLEKFPEEDEPTESIQQEVA